MGSGVIELKLVYLIKRLLVVILSIVLVATVDVMPDQPALYFAFFAICVVLIVTLWKSVLKDEKKIRKQRIRLCQESGIPQGLKRVA